MANPERMLKSVIEEIRNMLIPMNKILQNQDVIIIQNKQMIELLEQIRANLQSQDTETQTESDNV